MSRILEDERSWQIVRVVERKDAGVISFEEKQKEIKKLIVDERIQTKKDEFLKTTLSDYKSQVWTVFDPPEGAAEKQREEPPRAAQQRGATDRMR